MENARLEDPSCFKKGKSFSLRKERPFPTGKCYDSCEKKSLCTYNSLRGKQGVAN